MPDGPTPCRSPHRGRSTPPCRRHYGFLRSGALLSLVTLSLSAAAEEWRLHGLDHAETRHSPLTAIDRDNVGELGLAFEFDDFTVRGRTHRGNEATPLVTDGVLYVAGPWSVVYAIDGRDGRLLWKYDPGVPGQWVRKACCDAVNRGVAIDGDRVYVGTLDGWLDALDRATGERVWRVDTLVDRSRAYTITGAPRVAGDRIVIGNGGGELGVRGYVSAFERDGTLAWRFFTVPGRGPDEHPEVALARETWSADSRWEYGLGGTVWDSITWDPALDTLYIGVGNGSPWPAWRRSPGGGDNLFLSSIVALDAETGRMRWHYQTTPGDSWDYTATQHMILADLEIGGRQRRVLLQAPKNGFFYVLDRVTGELISAAPYTRVTWAKGIESETGRPVVDASANYGDAGRTVEPSLFGGHNWQPMSFHPATGLVYVPVLEARMRIGERRRDYLPDSINVGAAVAGPGEPLPADPLLDDARAAPRSRLVAWDPVRQRAAWRSLPEPFWGGGVLTTAGGLVLHGSADGALWIHDSADGTPLRRIETGTAILGSPVAYMLDGRQYIAVLAGFGGAPKAYPPGSAPLAFDNHERLLVFTLGGGPVPKPPPRRPEPAHVPHPQGSFDIALAAAGRRLFMEHCARCHTERGAPSAYPNLWNLPAGLYDGFGPIVLEGAMAGSGMPGFGDLLDPDDVRAIREYLLRDEALHGAPRP